MHITFGRQTRKTAPVLALLAAAPTAAAGAARGAVRFGIVTDVHYADRAAAGTRRGGGAPRLALH